MAAPINYPLHKLWHTFFVLKEEDKIHRWDVWHDKSKKAKRWGHLHYNRFEPWLGNKKWIWDKHPRFASTLVHQIKGKKDSHAHDLVTNFSNIVHKYPHKHEYHFVPGTNSNTFVYWMLKKLNIKDIHLPKKAMGKNYLNKIWTP